MISPTAWARYSANIERDESGFHPEPISAPTGNWARRATTAANRSSVRKPNGMAKG